MSTTKTTVNEIDLKALDEVVKAIENEADLAKAFFELETVWRGQTRSATRTRRLTLGGEPIERTFTIEADEPSELLGSNSAPNPQELLIAAVNACMLVGYVAGASVHGIDLESVTIVTTGELDLRGFLDLEEGVPAGYENLDYTVRIKGNGTPEQFEEIHEHVKKTSPNYFNMSRVVAMNAKLEVE